MSKILNTLYLILNTILGAFRSFKDLTDPAIEGSPYIVGESGRLERDGKRRFFTSRRFVIR